MDRWTIVFAWPMSAELAEYNFWTSYEEGPAMRHCDAQPCRPETERINLNRQQVGIETLRTLKLPRDLDTRMG